MNPNESLVLIFAIAVGLIIAVTAILTDAISKHKLRVEKIKADTIIRTEEIRAKNQLELEKMIHQEAGTLADYRQNSNESDRFYNESSHAREKIRE